MRHLRITLSLFHTQQESQLREVDIYHRCLVECVVDDEVDMYLKHMRSHVEVSWRSHHLEVDIDVDDEASCGIYRLII